MTEMIQKVATADLVVAFPGGKGTAMMVRVAEKTGGKVQRVTEGL